MMDFEPVFLELLGGSVSLSRNAIVRLTRKWESEYRSWFARKHTECSYAYTGWCSSSGT